MGRAHPASVHGKKERKRERMERIIKTIFWPWGLKLKMMETTPITPVNSKS